MSIPTRRIAILFCTAFLAPSAAKAQQSAGSQTVRIKDNEDCPQGMTEIRPRLCQAPELPPPSIVDYRPRSTLVTSEHLVPRAKYPAIDFHGHPRESWLDSGDSLAWLGAALDRINVRVMVVANGNGSSK